MTLVVIEYSRRQAFSRSCSRAAFLLYQSVIPWVSVIFVKISYYWIGMSDAVGDFEASYKQPTSLAIPRLHAWFCCISEAASRLGLPTVARIRLEGSHGRLALIKKMPHSIMRMLTLPSYRPLPHGSLFLECCFMSKEYSKFRKYRIQLSADGCAVLLLINEKYNTSLQYRHPWIHSLALRRC